MTSLEIIISYFYKFDGSNDVYKTADHVLYTRRLYVIMYIYFWSMVTR